MTLSTSTSQSSTNDIRLVEEAIRRVCKMVPGADRHVEKLRDILLGELNRGRRDMFSLVRAARKAVDEA